MDNGIRVLQITFPTDVEVTDDQCRKLVDLANEICEAWEKKNPTMVMWPFGIGTPITNIYTAGDDEPLKFREGVFQIEVTARERYEGE